MIAPDTAASTMAADLRQPAAAQRVAKGATGHQGHGPIRNGLIISQVTNDALIAFGLRREHFAFAIPLPQG